MEEFNNAETKGCLSVMGVPVAPEFTDDRKEDTLVRALCWKCGPIVKDVDGFLVRLPLQNCQCAEAAE